MGIIMPSGEVKAASNIWRFYITADQRWKWQHLSALRELVSESPLSFESYEQCLASAQQNGYEFKPAHQKLTTARGVSAGDYDEMAAPIERNDGNDETADA
jgi:hypothetical protein